jgi:hypothetical protein
VFRADNRRSGWARTRINDEPAEVWSVKVGGKLSAPVAAAGRIFVCSVAQHVVYALDLEAGKMLWSTPAGARVDSPPTWHGGRVYFGAADGTVQCLDADSGELVWRFLAAPVRSAITVRGQLESPWPVAGSVLVRDDTVYAFAGRSSFIDGGMYMVKLDADTGEPRASKRIYDRDPETGRQTVDDVNTIYLAGLSYDVPSSEGDSIFLREACLNLDGVRQDEAQAHLYSPGGFLDDAWWDRYAMVYGARFKDGPGGSAFSRTYGAPCGRLLVCDDNNVYGYDEPRDDQFRMFHRTKHKPEPGRLREAWSDDKWPILVTGLALARPKDDATGGRLVAAGAPAEALSNVNALRGEEGGLLLVADPFRGEILSRCQIKSPPVFDGTIAAQGRIIISGMDGTLTVFR